MSLITTFIFASNFFTHSVMIAVSGLLLVEFFRSRFFHRQNISPVREQALVLVGVSVIAIAIWMILDYFVRPDALSQRVLFDIATILVVLYMLRQMWRMIVPQLLRHLILWYVVVAVVHVLLDTVLFFGMLRQYDLLLHIAFRIAESTAIFFITVNFIIHLNSERAMSCVPHLTRRILVGAGGIILGMTALYVTLLSTGVIAFYHGVSSGDPTYPAAQVTVRLSWIPQAEYAGMYVADQKGYYAEQGIAPVFLPFDFERFPVEDVAEGYGTFGIAAADEVLEARARGVPVVALAIIYQQSPAAAIVLASSSIHSVSDFAGRRIGVAPFPQGQMMLRRMLASVDLMLAEVTLVPLESDLAERLHDGSVDVIIGYATNQPLELQRWGDEVRIFYGADYGGVQYADVLFTTDRIIREESTLVKNFVAATLRGWEYALMHRDEAVSATLLYEDVPHHGSMVREHQAAMLDVSAPLIEQSQGRPIGSMDPQIWQDIYETLRETGLIMQAFNVRDAYTTSFLR